MTGYEAYEIFNSMNLHFNEGFDFVKYSGKAKTTEAAFEKRKDKFHFHKISKKYNRDDFALFVISNFIENDRVWVGELFEDSAIQNYNKHKKIIESMSYVFENECKKLLSQVDNPNSLLTTSGEYPILLSKYLKGEVCIETLCILDKLMNFLPMWNKKITDNIRWPLISNKIDKFRRFMHIDDEKYKAILKEVISDVKN